MRCTPIAVSPSMATQTQETAYNSCAKWPRPMSATRRRCPTPEPKRLQPMPRMRPRIGSLVRPLLKPLLKPQMLRPMPTLLLHRMRAPTTTERCLHASHRPCLARVQRRRVPGQVARNPRWRRTSELSLPPPSLPPATPAFFGSAIGRADAPARAVGPASHVMGPSDRILQRFLGKRLVRPAFRLIHGFI